MRRQAGFSLVEVLMMLALMGISLAAGAALFVPGDHSVRSGTTLLEGMLRQSRAKAMATMSAYRVSPVDSRNLRAETADTCGAATWVEDTDLAVQFPDNMTLASTAWTVCFSSRGISSNNQTLTLIHDQQGNAQVEVMVGGSTRVLP